jgi:peptidoglycan/LPS O-acetylase OafA/YrhL
VYIVTAVPLLVYLMADHVRLNPLAAKWATLLGNTTYSSYLLHFPIQLSLIILATAAGWSLPKEQPAFLLAFLVGSVALGAICYEHFEVPMQARIRRACLPGSQQ